MPYCTISFPQTLSEEELIWLTIRFTSHCVKNSKLDSFERIMRNTVCTCSSPSLCPLHRSTEFEDAVSRNVFKHRCKLVGTPTLFQTIKNTTNNTWNIYSLVSFLLLLLPEGKINIAQLYERVNTNCAGVNSTL